MCEGQKSNGFRQKWSMHTRLKHHLPIPSQYREGGPRVRGMRECGLAVGRRGSLFWCSHSNSFGEKCPVGMTFHPKEVNMNWNH